MAGQESPVLAGMRAQKKAKQAEVETLLKNPTPTDAIFQKASTLMDEIETLGMDIDNTARMEFDSSQVKARMGYERDRDSEPLRLMPFATGANGNGYEAKSTYAPPPLHRLDHVESEEIKLYRSGGFKSLGHFAYATYKAGRDGRGDETCIQALKKWDDVQLKLKSWDLQQKAPSGMFEQSDPDGGNLIPPEFSNQIYQRMVARNLILQHLSPLSVAGNNMTIPALKEDSRADGQRGGGILGYWQGEADQYTVSKTRTRTVELKLNKLTVYTFCTDELVNDSPISLQTWLLSKAPDEINFKLNDGVINGNGAGMPLGIMRSGSLITVNAVSGQGNNTFIYANVTAMYARVVAGQRSSMIWMYNQDVEPQLFGMYVATGTAAGVLVFTPNAEQAGGFRLLSRPALVMEQCQSLGTAGDVIAFAPEGYASITKGGMESFMSIHLRFDYDETAFKWRFRFDGQPYDMNPLTPFKGTNTVSSIVVLNSTRT